MWVLGFWQDLRDAAQAMHLLSQAYAAIASVKKEEPEEEDDKVAQLEEEVAKLKSEIRSMKKKKVVKRKR